MQELALWTCEGRRWFFTENTRQRYVREKVRAARTPQLPPRGRTARLHASAARSQLARRRVPVLVVQESVAAAKRAALMHTMLARVARFCIGTRLTSITITATATVLL